MSETTKVEISWELSKDHWTAEEIFKHNNLRVLLSRKNGQLFQVIIQGEATLNTDKTIELQYALNKLTGHI